jgi:death-on-curing protein
MTTKFPKVDTIISLHDRLISEYGGFHGVRDLGSVQSTFSLPQMTLDHDYFYSFPWGMAAAYLFFGVKNHGFNDGNKRSSLAACLLFLLLNGFKLEMSDEELIELVVGVACNNIHRDEIGPLLKKNCTSWEDSVPEDYARDYLLSKYHKVFEGLSYR